MMRLRFSTAAVQLVSLLVTVQPLCAQRAPVEGARCMVVSVHGLASEAGVEILKKGGNAVDAAVATGFALAAVYPWAGNLGGGGFMLIHLAGGRNVAIDYRETAPAGASRTMYLGNDGQVIKDASTVGWRASGVPGTVAGLALAFEKYGSGKVTWAEVLEPARRLASRGHIVTPYTAYRLRSKAKLLSVCDDTRRIYLNGGAFWQPGDLWRQPELASTLARLQRGGPDEFYAGETARKIASAMAAHGGLVTLADLRAYRAVERTPVSGVYRGYTVVTMPLPSSGGITLLEMLAMLEPFEVAALGSDSAGRYHLFIEVMRRAYRVRAEFLGDPDSVHVPVAGLLAPDYINRLMKDYNTAKATRSADLALPVPLGEAPSRAINPMSGSRPQESTETTHFSVIDGDGNAVANTYTLNGGYGSGITIPETGILMNNEMDDFTAKPGVPNAYGLIQGEANAIAPGKRPLSSMTPTFVFKDGRLVLVTGSPGGSTIINTVLEVVTNVIDFGLPVAKAVDAPRIHHQWLPDVVNYEPGGLSDKTAATLRSQGHVLAPAALYDPNMKDIPLSEYYQGDAESAAIDWKTMRRVGAADPRKPDAKAIGY